MIAAEAGPRSSPCEPARSSSSPEPCCQGSRCLSSRLQAPSRSGKPEYPKYAELAGDPRWKRLTPRILLDHSPGFPNFRFLNPDGKLDFKFDPGTRYAYSGEGINLSKTFSQVSGGGALNHHSARTELELTGGAGAAGRRFAGPAFRLA